MNPNHLRAAVKIGYDSMHNRVMAWLFVDGKRSTPRRAPATTCGR
jgi:hypothetical protein